MVGQMTEVLTPGIYKAHWFDHSILIVLLYALCIRIPRLKDRRNIYNGCEKCNFGAVG